MAKESYYFSHDYGSRNDPKLVKVLMVLKQEGKGVYWDLIEMLYEEGGYLILSECESYAFALRTDSKIITSLINDFDLFKKDGDRFYSESVLKRLKNRQDKSDTARESAKKRWSNANALPTKSKRIAIKERKGKEKKEKKVKDMDSLEEVLIYCKEKLGDKFMPLKISIESKYEYWKENGWNDGYGEKISNVKTKMMNAVPHLKPMEDKEQKATVDYSKYGIGKT